MNQTIKSLKLILFGTSACHLCDIADELIRQVLTHYPYIQLEWIDIAEHTEWQEKYAIRIPVLLSSTNQHELGWPFDEAAVVKFINELEND